MKYTKEDCSIDCIAEPWHHGQWHDVSCPRFPAHVRPFLSKDQYKPLAPARGQR